MKNFIHLCGLIEEAKDNGFYIVKIMKTYKHLKILKDEIFTINLGLLELANIELWDKLVNSDIEISKDKFISTIDCENEL